MSTKLIQGDCLEKLKVSPDKLSAKQKDMLTIFRLHRIPTQVVKDGASPDYSLFGRMTQKEFKAMRGAIFRIKKELD